MVRTTGPSQYLLIGAKVTSEDLAPDLSILFLALLARGMTNKGRCLSLLLLACVALGAETISLSVRPAVFSCTIRSLMATL